MCAVTYDCSPPAHLALSLRQPVPLAVAKLLHSWQWQPCQKDQLRILGDNSLLSESDRSGLLLNFATRTVWNFQARYHGERPARRGAFRPIKYSTSRIPRFTLGSFSVHSRFALGPIRPIKNSTAAQSSAFSQLTFGLFSVHPSQSARLKIALRALLGSLSVRPRPDPSH